MDEIILQENNELISEDESHGNIYSKIDKKGIYEIDNMSHDEKKKRLNELIVHLKVNPKIHMRLKIIMV